jgi:vitamin B12 transporter
VKSNTVIALAAGVALVSSFLVHAEETVVITATRTPRIVGELLNDVSVISREDIARSGQSTLADLLRSIPGVDVGNNGGPGKTTSVFLRGANSAHTLVLVDGMRISSATLGTTALEHIPLGQIDRIEVLRGPASSLYGADAIGGVIQIFTKAPSGPAKPTLNVGVGSYGTYSAGAGWSGEANGTRFSLQAGRYETAGFSAIKNPASSSFNPDADGYRNTNFSGQVARRFGSDHEVGARVFYSDGLSHYDTSFPSRSFDFRLAETLSSSQLYSRNRLAPNWQSVLRYGESEDRSTNITAAASSSLFRTRQGQLSWQNDIKLGDHVLIAGIERLQQKVGGDTSYVVNERTITSALAGFQGRFGDHRLQLNARNDNNSQFGGKSTGMAGYGYQLSPALRAGVSAGTAYNAPSFNQLYFPGFGVPTLRPEQAVNREASLKFEQGAHQAGIVYFSNKVTDLIVNTGPSFAPTNVNEADLTGTSFTYKGQLGNYQVRANLDLQDPKDASTGHLLPRRAKQHLNTALTRTFGRWTVGTELSASSERYDDAANTKRLGGYGIVNAYLDYAIEPNWSVLARFNNLFNKSYELVRDYGVPGANFFVALRYQPR